MKNSITYRIPETELENLTQQLRKLRDRAHKLGVDSFEFVTHYLPSPYNGFVDVTVRTDDANG